MTSQTNFEISVPASSANLGPGFDGLGYALNLRNIFSFSLLDSVDTFEITQEGEGDETLLNPQKNLLIHVYREACQKHNKPIQGFRLHAKNQIPLDGGMGSSATAILAGIATCRFIHQLDLDKANMLNEALEFENHPDNLGAALYGGFTAGIMLKNKKEAQVISVPTDPNLKCLLIHPRMKVSTEESRKRLPINVGFKDAIYSLNRACFFTMAMLEKRYDLFFEGMKDKLHEPGRMNSKVDYPSLKVKLSRKHFYGWAISGSGPSVILFCKEYATDILEPLNEHFWNLQIPYNLYRLIGDNEGLILTPKPS